MQIKKKLALLLTAAMLVTSANIAPMSAQAANSGDATTPATASTKLSLHIHGNWTYEVSGATLTAKCYDYANCNKSVALTLTASDANYSGSAYTGASTNNGTGDGKVDFTGITKATLGNISYAAQGTALDDKTEGAWSETAPTAVGKYTAKVTVTYPAPTEQEPTATATVTATKDFEITKATPHIATNPTASELTYGYTLSVSTLSGGAAQHSNSDATAVTGTFAWTTGTTVPTVGNSGYEVTFTPTGDSAANYGTATCTVTPTVAAKALTADNITVTAPTANGSDLGNSVVVKFGNTTLVKGTDYEVTYAPAEVKEAGEYKATITFKGNYSGTDVEKTFTVSKPSSGGGSSASSITLPAATKHGKVAVDKKAASSGATVTLTVTPDKGYTLETLTVKDAKGNTVEVTKVNDTTYTFKMPGSKVTVEATFMEDNSMLNFFVDVHANDYYYDAVLWAAENGITSGTDAVHFTPNGVTTRAQVVTFLWRAAGCPEPKAMSSFSDVADGSYYEKAVAWAVENGITSGVGGNRFAPDSDCTRGQIVTFLYRFNGMDTMNIKDNPFGDVAEGQFYYDAVLWAAENGVTSGTSATTFSPASNCLRGQVVTFLYRLLNK